MRGPLAAVAGMVIAGCGGPEIPRPACPDRVNALFNIIGEDDNPYITGRYDDWPSYGIWLESEDGCTTYSTSNDDVAPDLCNGACSDDERCFARRCEPKPEALDVGVVRFTGFDRDVALSAGEALSYYSEYIPHQPGAEITVTGGGQSTGVEEFSIGVLAVPPLSVGWAELVATADGDLHITWDPADSPPGSRIEFYALSNGIIADSLECWSKDTGEMTVPAEQLDHVLSPESGAGVTTAILRRISAGTVETEHGCGALQTMWTMDVDLRRGD